MDIFGIGFPELVFIFIIALMVFGPRRLPEIAGKAGKFVRDLRNMSQGFMTEWQREITVAARMEEIQSVRKELEETKQALTQTRTEIASEAAQVSKAANTFVGHSVTPPSTPYIKPMPPATETSPPEKSPDSVTASPSADGSASPVEETDSQKNGTNHLAKVETKAPPTSPPEATE